MFMTYPLLADAQMFSTLKCVQPAHLVETKCAYSVSRAKSLCASMHQRPSDGPHQWSRVFFRRSATVVRSSHLVSEEPWSTVRKEQRALGRILCLLRSHWSLRCLDVCKRGFAFAVRDGCRELASESGRASERTRLKSSSRSVRARSCALSTVAPEVVSVPRKTICRLPSGKVATAGSVTVGIGGL